MVVLFVGCSATNITQETNELKKVALVIGNKNYKNKALINPINDAKGISDILKKMGFEVLLKTDLTQKGFDRALNEFKKKIDHNSILFFYFAGHANTLQRNSSEEFLAMIEEGRKKTIISLYRLYSFLREVPSRYNIVVIDACRNYQKHSKVLFTNQRGIYRGDFDFDSGQLMRGEVLIDNNYSANFPRSTLVSYATMHNQIANDKSKKDDTHSPYTRALIEHLDDEEIPIEEVFKRIRGDMIDELGGEQINLEESSLEKNIWLQPKRGAIPISTPF